MSTASLEIYLTEKNVDMFDAELKENGVRC